MHKWSPREVGTTRILKEHIVNGVTINIDRLRELEKEFEALKDNNMKHKFFLNRFIGGVARKDVVDVLIERVDRLFEDIKGIKRTALNSK